MEAQVYAGHSKVQMTGHYTLLQKRRVEELLKRMQERGSATREVVAFGKKKA